MISFKQSSAHGIKRPQLRHAEYRDGSHIGFAADRSEADLVLPQGEAAVLTHLISVSTECPEVVLLAGDRVVRGVIGVPELDRLEIPFQALDKLAGLPANGIVTVRYILAGDAVRFKSRMVRRKTGWRIALPRAIETTSRRLAPRHGVHDSWRVSVRPGGLLSGETLPVVDAAAGGLGLRVPPAKAAGLVGRILNGVLRDVTGFAVPLQLKVHHLRSAEDPSAAPIIGTSFQGVGFDNQLRVTKAIQRQMRRRQQRAAMMAAADQERALSPEE